MKSVFARTAISLAAASMALTPIAAQANTRAGDDAAIYSGGSASQSDDDDDDSGAFLVNDRDGLAAIILALLAGSLLIGGIVLVDSGPDLSPGT